MRKRLLLVLLVFGSLLLLKGSRFLVFVFSLLVLLSVCRVRVCLLLEL